MNILTSNEADIEFLLLKYDSNFNYALGSEFGERDRVLFIGPFKTTIVSFFVCLLVCLFLWPCIISI